MSQEQLNIALIGCGGIAQAHWKGLQAHAPRLRVTAVIDADAQRAQEMADKTGGKPFTDLGAALAADGLFDAVDIMLPHHLHEETALAAFAAGKHVVLEKPMAPTLDACDRILAAAQDAGTVFMVAEQSEYWPEARKIRELIQAGAIGEIITARAAFTNTARQWSGEIPWRFKLAEAGGGITMDGGAHWLRPLRMWLGEVDQVVAVTGRPIAEMEGESFARALLQFESGVVAEFDAWGVGTVHGPSEEFRVTGTEGELIVERGGENRLMLYTREHPDGEVLWRDKAAGRAAAFGYELDDFSQAVLTGSPLAAGPEYSLGELRTAFAIYRSAETRQWEKVWA